MALAHVKAVADLTLSSESDLVGLARQGGEAAIRALIKRNNQQLFRVARAVLRNDGEAEDVVQETYVRAFTGLDSFRGEARFSTWLTRIALNDALGRVRRRRPVAELSEIDIASFSSTGSIVMFPTSLNPPPADTELGRKEMRLVLERAIDELPEGFRVVFVLRDVEGLSVEETADQLALKPETVKTRLHRARKLMRAAIEKRLAPTFSELFPFDDARCDSMADKVMAKLAGAEPSA